MLAIKEADSLMRLIENPNSVNSYGRPEYPVVSKAIMIPQPSTYYC
jgi:hypothetical protein